MKDRSYDRIANVLMLIAVASALMFDSGVFPKVFVGAIGGIAALASACLYFTNQPHGDEQPCESPETKAKEKTVAPVAPVEALMKAADSSITLQTTADLAARWVVTMAKREKHYVVVHHHRHANLKVSDRAFYGGFPVHQDIAESNVVLSPNDVAACAIEIIQQLSKKDGDDRWEFHFGSSGLRVSAKKGHSEAGPSVSSQGDFEFPSYFPTTMVQ